jgi:transglutaminase-like putative cysteine protease
METNRTNMKYQSASFHWWDITSLFLVVVILSTVCARLAITHWTKDLSITFVVMYLGLLSGIALGFSHYNKTRSILFSAYYGIFVVIWQLGSTIRLDISWYDRLIIINNRIGLTITYLLAQKPVLDNLFFLSLMSLLFWMIGSYAGFTLIRYADPWKIIIPSGIGIVIIHSYDYYVEKRIWYLVVYLFFSLILIIRMVYLHHRQEWQSEEAIVPSNVSAIFSRIAIVAALALLALVWVAPVEAKSFQAAVNAWEKVKQPFKDVREDFENAFASLKSSVGIVPESYASTLNLGRGSSLSESEIFTVLTPKNPPAGTRYYWRVRVYQTYENGQWTSMALDNISIEPGKNDLKIFDEPNRNHGNYSFYFTSVRPVSTLFLAPQPLGVSVPARVELIYNTDDTADILAIKADPYLTASASYQVRASLSGATIRDLQNAGEVYPDWVTERYLQLPDSVTQRTKDLAMQITNGRQTPYDKVAAITEYLRNAIKYSETVPTPPANQDLVDWFLFDLREGFCNYYASSEVILLRSLGIPARLAAGYAQGEPVELTGTYIVKERDGHAWPEVYFPGLGWVEFEPTSSQPALERLSGEIQQEIPTPVGGNQNTDNIGPEEKPEAPTQDTSGNTQKITILTIIRGLLIGSILAALLIILILIINTRKTIIQALPPIPILIEQFFRKIGLEPPEWIKKWAFFTRLPAISQAYQELNEALSRLGNRPNPNKTPKERAGIMASIIPDLNMPAQTLVNQYEIATYGISSPDLISAKVSSQQIKYLTFREVFRRRLGGVTPIPVQDKTSD